MTQTDEVWPPVKIPTDQATRRRFALETGNRVFSDIVCLAALGGRQCEVQQGAGIDATSTIGSYTYIGFHSFVMRSEVGRYCSIANNVSIGPSEHNLAGISTSGHFADNTFERCTEKPCAIGSDVWIASSCVVRRGVTMGHGSVLGANSFLNSDLPPYAIAVGTPARILRYRFREEQIAVLLASKWWELELEEARKAQEELRVRMGLGGR